MTAPIPHPGARAAEVQAEALRLIEAFAFDAAEAVLAAYRKETETRIRTRLEQLFLDWSALPPADRPDFLTYAHHRRHPLLTPAGDAE